LEQLKLYRKDIPFTLERFFNQYKHISEEHQEHVFLESGRGGQYSLAAFSPEKVLIGRNGQLEVIKNGTSETWEGNPLHLLKEQLSEYEVEQEEEIPGGTFGYISYDYARQIERLPKLAEDDLKIPELYFFVCDQWFVFDHVNEVLTLVFIYKSEDSTNLEQRVAFWEDQWSKEYEPAMGKGFESMGNNPLEVSMNEQEFIEAVEKIQHYISQGDVFQVNLSVRQSKSLHASGLEVYEQLRKINPSPYMGYFHTRDFQIVSGSPELLIKKQGNMVSTRPIAGTRSRGNDEAEDSRLANELIENEKERAEHVMLVDLERNDLGRVCKYGTVQVNEFMVIEKYSHVMHIVSNVQGVLAEDKDGINLTDAVFPGGTITGTPKVRTMEIIEELEPVRRGPYTGSLGWIGYNGDLELNIIIRTMLVKDGKAHIQAGAGIVIDSLPKNEYKEALKKAAVLWAAKDLAESVKRGSL
jgi:para-aminobenzoate synthetase component I